MDSGEDDHSGCTTSFSYRDQRFSSTLYSWTAPIAVACPQNRLARAPTTDRLPSFFSPGGPRSSAICARDCRRLPTLEPRIGYGVITTLSRGWMEGANPWCWCHLQLPSGAVGWRDGGDSPRPNRETVAGPPLPAPAPENTYLAWPLPPRGPR